MPDEKDQVKEGYRGHWAGIVGFAALLFLGYIGYEHYKTQRESASAATTSQNLDPTVSSSSPLTVLEPTALANTTSQTTATTNNTTVYPVSVTDPGAFTPADLQYGVSTNPQFSGEKGISLVQYERLVG